MTSGSYKFAKDFTLQHTNYAFRSPHLQDIGNFIAGSNLVNANPETETSSIFC